jgi:nitrogen fixation NifU-like protein
MSPELIDHFSNPRNVGELPPPAITVQVENPICGDILRLSVGFEEGHATEVRYKVRGCTASIATGSALTQLIQGNDLAVLRAITRDQVEAAIGGLSNESKHAAQLAIDGLVAVLRQFHP